MKPIARMMAECSQLCEILEPGDFAYLLLQTMHHAPEILKTHKLTALDAAMSRDLIVHYRKHDVAIPVAQIDGLLAGKNDNPTFGNVREMYGRDCYLAPMRLPASVGTVLDLGANRGLFELLALVAMGAENVVGVEPVAHYEHAEKLLVRANGFSPACTVRYNRLIGSPSTEKQNPQKYVSVNTVVKEQGIQGFGFVKIDIEGCEKDLFREPEWLALVDNLAMELHGQMAGDLSLIPRALEEYGFAYKTTGQSGEVLPLQKSMFLYASRTGALHPRAVNVH